MRIIFGLIFVVYGVVIAYLNAGGLLQHELVSSGFSDGVNFVYSYYLLGSVLIIGGIYFLWLGSGEFGSAAVHVEADTVPDNKNSLSLDRSAGVDHSLDDKMLSAQYLLTLLQAKGRLLDFAASDLSKYSDQQIAGVARVIHQGLGDVMGTSVCVEPVCSVREGEGLTLSPDYSSEEYRVLGKVKDSASLSGRVVHCGWKLTKLDLPYASRKKEGNLAVIQPAEIEVS